MREESSINKRIDWRSYESPSLMLDQKKTFYHIPYKSCGSASLSLITGLSPGVIERSCPNPKIGWFTTRAVKFLKEKGYSVIELSKENILNAGWPAYPLNENHCLLMNVRVDSMENSMFVVHKGKVWHHYDPTTLDGLFFLNKPTQDVLLVYHKKWK